MKPGERRRLLASTGATWNRLVDMIRDGHLDRLHDAQPGLRAASYGDDPVSSSNVSDPTGSGAGQPDRTVSNLNDFTTEVEKARRALDAAGIILANYGKPHRATESDRLALQRVNSLPDPQCEHCATISEPHSKIPFDCPPNAHRKNATTVGGRLVKAKLLCTFCIDFVYVHGRLPSDDELIQHRDRSVVRVRDSKKAS